MIRKLMKYQIKDIIKIPLIIYAIALVFAGLTRVLSIWNNIQLFNILSLIFAGITYSAIGSAIINSFAQILRVFNNSLFKDESYLTHTLPIKRSKILLSEFLSALVVTIISMIVSFLSLLIVFYSNNVLNLIKIAISSAFGNVSAWLVIALVVLALVFEIIYITALSLLSCIKGNQYNKNHIGHGLLWFFIYYAVGTVISLVIAFVTLACFGRASELFSSVLSPSALLIILVAEIILYMVFSILIYFISQRELSKGVNVD